MANYKIYTVRDKRTGDVLVRGTSKECAACCGIKLKLFYNTVWQASRGIHPQYAITKEEVYNFASLEPAHRSKKAKRRTLARIEGAFGSWVDATRAVPRYDMDDEGFLIRYLVGVEGRLTAGVCCYDPFNNEWFVEANLDEAIPVTHWMPMPAIP